VSTHGDDRGARLDRVVQTVLGPVDPATLGTTTMHEHLWMDSTPLLAVHGYRQATPGPWTAAVAAEARWNPGVHPANYRLTDVAAAVEELEPFVAAGGRTIVELTPPALGRDPRRVREIAERAGVHVVLGAGQYVEPVHEAWVAAADETGIAARLVSEAMDGIDGTGIRAGIFGEIGTLDPVRPGERRVLRGAAAASRETGLAISVHLHPWGHEGPAVLDELVSAGVDTERVILGHLNTAIDRVDELRGLADRGAVLGFDLFGFDHSLLGPGRWPPSDRDVAAVIVQLLRNGHRDRIVLGQDVGVRTRYRRWGGWGYPHLLEHVVPLLRELGAGDDDVRAMLEFTPARLLSMPA
jgi:phosphotriesterase-related protein